MTAGTVTDIRCDLCGSRRNSLLLKLYQGESMLSDWSTFPCPLIKRICKRCGLVRGEVNDIASLERHYAEEYRFSERSSEHLFYTQRGALERSVVICDWIVSATGSAPWESASSVLEVGPGSGRLLAEFARRYPGTAFEGIELNRIAAQEAKERGLKVAAGDWEQLEGRAFSGIYCVAVLEHVPSPTRFLRAVHGHLESGGLVVLCQPTQDVISYDLFFTDHLHHFGPAHLSAFAEKCGFEEIHRVVSHPLMPNFSLHVWRRREQVDPAFVWSGRPVETACARAALEIGRDLERLESKLRALRSDDRKVGVFGLREAYRLMCTYSTLGSFPIRAGFDDQPDRPEYADLGFPVTTPEQGVALGIEDVLLTMNRIYYRRAGERLERLGFRVHPVFS